MTLLATCAAGCEKILASEIRKLKETSALNILDAGFGNVVFASTSNGKNDPNGVYGIYYALMSLRTADRIFLLLNEFYAADFDELFEGTRAIPFEELIPDNFYISVDKVRTRLSKLSAQNAIQAIVHKAAAERLCQAYKKERLNENGTNAVLRVYIDKDKARILLDICGAPLFKRGYREDGGGAPLRETTAAALLFLSRWRRKIPLCDPFCGSGTIAIEAALYAWNAAPCMHRPFSFNNLLIADKQVEDEVRSALKARIDFSVPLKIVASDAERGMVDVAKSNLQRAIRLVCGTDAASPKYLPDFWALKMEDAKALDEEGIIICNPPYGKRLGTDEDAIANYKKMSALQKNFPSWKICVLSDHSGFESFYGSRSSNCTKIINGPIETYFYEYAQSSQAAPAPAPAYAHVKESKEVKESKKSKKTIDWTW
ncbi:MAG: class I SAM-dependent RNA methyltransferase [Termitinemataceae bacterium]|nr:MAG: class I SAM-dependent RNA methyltransferase [Termitinemataceae bacterium]